MTPSRTLLLLILLTTISCTGAQNPAPVTTTGPSVPHGLTIEEEATILRLEDRREFDPAIASAWLAHANPLHRSRMALALGRIGGATFIDSNSNGEKDPDERQAGTELLARLVTDNDPTVRRMAAFALGEIGDKTGIDALFLYAADREHADVAAEAAEALAKIAADVPVARYEELTGATQPEGVRARAIRYLFRFDKDEASAIALRHTEDTAISIRREATYALGRRAYAPAATRLQALMADGDMLTRSYAARALGRIGEASGLGSLLAALRDPHPWVRTNSAFAISLIAQKNPDNLKRTSLVDDALKVMSLTGDRDPGTRAAATETLGHYARLSTQARNRLLEIAVKGSSVEREIATGAVARAFGEEDKSPLEALLQTDSSWIKVRAVEASNLMTRRGAALRKRFAADESAMVRGNVLAAIPDAEVDAEASLIDAALEDPDEVVRASAIDRFAARKKLSQDQRLERLLDIEQRAMVDPSNDARLSAISSIGDIDHPGREAFLRERLSDRDPVVRRVAAGLIAEKLKKNIPQYTPLPSDRPLSFYQEVATWARERHTATIHLDRGRIELVLLPQDAPMTVKNFADLAARGYFNGTSFMRVVPNFVIQGGDPRNDMSGGPGYAIRDEINQQKYTRGAVGMALSGPDTGGSQFFITHSPQPHLDGGYTIFARVSDGMDSVVDQVQRGDKVLRIMIDEVRPSGNR